jgi:hypothetical protein
LGNILKKKLKVEKSRKKIKYFEKNMWENISKKIKKN